MPTATTTETTATSTVIHASINWKEKIIDYLLLHSGAIIAAIIIVLAGFMIARWLSGLALRALEKKNVEPPVRILAGRLVYLLTFGFSLAIALQTMEVNLLPLIAGVSVVGVGAGLAMQGVLSNLVAGLVIILTKKFRVGEFIEVVGVNGQVAQIELISTTLIHADRSRVIIPNRKIIGEILHNYGMIRQLDLSVGVAYGTDVNKLQAAIREILNSNPRVLKDPAPAVGLVSFGDAAVKVAISPWVKVDDFGAAQGELNQAILERIHAKQIELPSAQKEFYLVTDPAKVA